MKKLGTIFLGFWLMVGIQLFGQMPVMDEEEYKAALFGFDKKEDSAEEKNSKLVTDSIKNYITKIRGVTLNKTQNLQNQHDAVSLSSEDLERKIEEGYNESENSIVKLEEKKRERDVTFKDVVELGSANNLLQVRWKEVVRQGTTILSTTNKIGTFNYSQGKQGTAGANKNPLSFVVTYFQIQDE